MHRFIAGLSLCALAVSGQQTSSATHTAEAGQTATITATQISDGPHVAGFSVAGGAAGPTVAGAPYSAQIQTQHVQTLADGNRIVETTQGSVARDGQGRVRRDEALSGFPGTQADAPHLVFIDDPVAGVHWNLDAHTKTAFKLPFVHVPPPGAGAPFSISMPPPPPPPGPDKVFFYSSDVMPKADLHIMTRAQVLPDSQGAKTDLGTDTVAGVKAQGTKITRTIPAGTIGNEQPLVITTETWYSPNLKVLVMSKTSDPRIGETTYRLTDIQRAEPAADLFEIPADYTIKSGPANVIYRTKKEE
jgi:hypothetical protein